MGILTKFFKGTPESSPNPVANYSEELIQSYREQIASLRAEVERLNSVVAEQKALIHEYRKKHELVPRMVVRNTEQEPQTAVHTFDDINDQPNFDGTADAKFIKSEEEKANALVASFKEALAEFSKEELNA